MTLTDTVYTLLQICAGLFFMWASLVAQLVKNLPAMRETWAPSLGWGDLLEKGEAPHSSVLAWRIPRTGRAEISEEARVHLFLRCLPASIAESSAPEGKGLSVTRLWIPRGSHGAWEVTVLTETAEMSAAASISTAFKLHFLRIPCSVLLLHPGTKLCNHPSTFCINKAELARFTSPRCWFWNAA